MTFKDKHIHKFYAFALAAVFALTLAGCGGGGGTAQEPEPAPMQTPQEMCEGAGGEYRDGTCVTAAELTEERMAAQRSAISTAIGAATTAVNAVDNDSSDADVSAADTALANARSAIAAGDDLSDEEKAANTGTVDALATLLDGAKTARTAAMDAAQTAADAAAMADAQKLYKGLEHGLGDATNVRTVATADTGVITVTNGNVAQVLAEDKKTTVAANHGWEGKKHTASGTGVVGTYEAYVYSNVGDAEEGNPFNEAYTLDATTGETPTLDTTDAAVAGRVASSSFDQSAGTKTFKLPTNTVRVTISGSYHGVSGTYYCTPTGGGTDCSAAVAASGFTLAGGTWTFKPTSATAKVSEVADTVYASYGWWLHKSADGDTFTASAFATARGTVPAATGITALRGTATYMGGAAGKYALYSSTGGTNDAGHFTARATLEADFNADMITGTIDSFIGADGQARDWSVELMKQGIADGGVILGDDGTGTAGTDEKMTKWTIGGTAAAAAGQWSGALYDNGADSVPKVGTGTFHSTYSTSGRMVGGFGVNKQ